MKNWISNRPNSNWFVLFLILSQVLIAGCSQGESSKLNLLLPALLTDLENDDDHLRRLMADAGVEKLEPIGDMDENQLALGEALFFDPILSGPRNVSCATCHHPGLVAGDGLVLPVGVGASGTGKERTNGASPVVIHRNSPEIHNRLDPSFRSLFWDGRVERRSDGSFRTPAGEDLPEGLNSVLAAQILFPVLSRTEMRGFADDGSDENEIADFSDDDEPGAWNALINRLLSINEYRILFAAAYPEESSFGFQHAANAIAAYTGHLWDTLAAGEWTVSDFNSYLAGDNSALNSRAKEGALLFFGEANCTLCHNGPLLSDQSFHNIGVPPIGPGFGNENGIDLGRYNVTGDQNDLYAFRTPPLREVEYSGPYMHNGVFSGLEDVIRHHLNPSSSYDRARSAVYPDYLSDYVNEMEWQKGDIFSTLDPKLDSIPDLSDDQIDLLIDFLMSLSSPTTLQLGEKVPDSVPSGLPVTGP